MIQWLQSMPAEWGNYASMLLFCGLAVLVWLIPINKISKGLSAPKKWQDIRLWATVLIALQLGIYTLF
ncbi:MAG: hypothetical protein VYD03_02870 [Pseudomonadota bacterium]|nr:hypothetical protein [Pseudomonadota bacterium]